MENKKVMIPVILGVMLLCGIVFTLVYKKTDGTISKEPEIQTMAQKETEPIETRVAGENTLKDFEVNETKELPKSVIVNNSGEVLSEEEAKEYEESIADSMKLETVTKEDDSEAIVDINGNEILPLEYDGFGCNRRERRPRAMRSERLAHQGEDHPEHLVPSQREQNADRQR